MQRSSVFGEILPIGILVCEQHAGLEKYSAVGARLDLPFNSSNIVVDYKCFQDSLNPDCKMNRAKP